MNKIKALREAKGLTQKQLAELADVPLRSLQKFDIGERDLRKAEAATVCRLAQVLSVSVGELLEMDAISYEHLKNQMQQYNYSITDAMNYCIDYCGKVDATIYEMIYKITFEE